MNRALFIVTSVLFLSVLFTLDSEAAPSTGTIEVAFILSEFNDQPYQEEYDLEYFEELAFGETDSMWHYYDEVSRGQLNVQGTVYGPYTLDGDAADYGTENTDFVRDSVEISDDDIDFRDYDAVVVVHSGPGEESSGNSDDIWSVHWPSISITTEDNGYIIRKISQVPEYESVSGENRPLGVWVHEFGHEIGLPDLYDTDGSSAGIGDWGVMASGSWGNNGETPVYMSAWCRYWLGWVEPIIITDDISNLIIEPVENDGDVYLLPIPGNWSNSKQYYLLENRQQISYDAYLPSEGLLIWHIDEEILDSKWNSNSVNNDEEHKGVDLEEADGDDDLDSKTNYGDAGDPYTSGSFTKESYPNSLAYNGTESGWKIENIEVDGDDIIVDISFLSKPHAVADADDAVVAEGFELQFYGNESWDEDGTIINYTWDFGDGNFAYNDNPLHIFEQNGTYEVILTVCDNNNLCDSMILSIFVNKPPIAVVDISQYIVMLGENIIFDASESYDIDGDVEFYYWNFDDGYTSNQAYFEHEYKNAGIYNVSLKIIDDLQDITTIYYTIEVINKLPNVSFGITPEAGNTLETFQFTDFSYDDDGEIELWIWNFGDGNTSSLQNPNHQFSLPGIYLITLSVTDDQDGTNLTTLEIEVTNSPPNPDIRIPAGINLGNKEWKVPKEQMISINGDVTFDNEGDDLQFFWTVNEQSLSGESIEFIFSEQTTLELRVLDSRGDEATEIFIIKPENVPSLTIANWSDYTNIAVDDNVELKVISENGDYDMYIWHVERLEIDERHQFLRETNTNDSLYIDWNQGEYLLQVSGRDIETNLWSGNFSMYIFIYNNQKISFEFDESINEGQWITFNAGKSEGYWNGSENLDEMQLELEYVWSLNGKELAGKEEITTVLVETGGNNVINLTLHQQPVGTSYYELEFYADYKPWGIMSTFPLNPRYGEDFELYLNAYDEESEAVIDSLTITVYDFEGEERAVLVYEDQGANFNIIFEVEYTGTMVLEYMLTDEMGNFQTNVSNVEVLGWVDVYIESLDIIGKKEAGKKQTIEFSLKNYNDTYQTSIYNGQTAVGNVDLLIEGNVVNTWTFEIEPTESKLFSYEWTSIAGMREFEVVAYVSDGEVITDNNNLTTTSTFTSERKTGILPSVNFYMAVIAFIAVAKITHRKSN